MSAARDAASTAQIHAADPAHSTWLAANAGSGKTRVLTDRVARLLLQGIDPQQILCLTYTKAAASEMQNRLFKRLGAWAMQSDAGLRAELRQLGEDAAPDAAGLARARTLFARAIETPGGLKIQTIHSFCAALLRRFPLEARVHPQFQEMETRAAELLQLDVLDAMIGEPATAPLVEALAMHVPTGGLADLLADIVSRREALTPAEDWNGIAAQFGISPDATADSLAQAAFADTDAALVARAIPRLRSQTSLDLKIADALAAIPSIDAAHLDAIADAILTKERTIKARFFTSRVQGALGADHVLLADFAERIAGALRAQNALLAARKTEALHAFAAAFLRRYRQEKDRRGWLDFDDLITRTRDLLADPAVSAWVLYRLDGGISHILVDEAQDTSPAQWDVIRKLAQDMTSGAGARPGLDRTIFVVGDKKQSIYSFQGADPDAFDRMGQEFGRRLSEAAMPFHPGRLEHSFRSADPILRTVDAVFADRAEAGFGAGTTHRAFHAAKPGRVDLWPVMPRAEDAPETDWTDPVDRVSSTHHTVRLANRIAANLKEMLAEDSATRLPEVDPSTRTVRLRKVRPADILILVQRRTPLFHALIRACKVADLPVAGPDRLRVGAELAVRDLLALLTFLTTPEDSLSLAVFLRSPLGGWSEQELFTLAHGRKSKFLWEALRGARDTHADTYAMLEDLRRHVDFLRPYDLLERILTRHGGRARLRGRLGVEAEDGLNALLGQALAYEQGNIPSLTGFLTWAKADDLEIKRQADSSSALIRIMTVHGAKGLEAPIVILPDCGKRITRIRDEILPTDTLAIWKTSDKPSPDLTEDALAARRASEERERQRLLYVAMTRAETWLIVAAAGDLSRDGSDWHTAVEAGMKTAGAAPFTFDEGPGLRLETGTWDGPAETDPPQGETPSPALAAHFRQPVGHAPEIVTPLSPSGLGGAKAIASAAGGETEEAMARGTYLHLLLEARFAAAEAEAHHLGLDGTTRDLLRAEAKAVREAPELAFIFAPGTLAEVGIVGEIRGKPMLGTIDRLIVTETKIIAVDYKSNAAVPDTAETTPEGILRQMGAYSALLAPIYPDREIECGIVWTTARRYMPLPQPLVEAALARAPLLDGADAAP